MDKPEIICTNDYISVNDGRWQHMKSSRNNLQCKTCKIVKMPLHVVFLHPDLGIGGAERLIIDAGIALKYRNCDVTYVTNHHDPNHCFPETKDGSLDVISVGDWIPRSIFGRCVALCAYLRMFYLTLALLFYLGPRLKPDVIFCDQIPISIPLLRFFGYTVLFYCHYPDLLLTQRDSKLKSAYRIPIDWIEEMSIHYANKIFVNSRFTRKAFNETFKSIDVIPQILYPSINEILLKSIEPQSNLLNEIPKNSFLFLSINRFDRKKNLMLAVKALQALKELIPSEVFQKIHLAFFGGYDERISENIICYDELSSYCFENNLSSQVTLLKSPSEEIKITGLHLCKCVLYTPENEHFGIVPLEAMFMKKPVIATNTGGPMETVDHEVTGYLADPLPESFAFYMEKFVSNPELSNEMGEAGRQRFDHQFSFKTFGEDLQMNVFTSVRR